MFLKKSLVPVTVLFCTIVLFVFAYASDQYGESHGVLSLHIPTAEEIRENGYPVNEFGETYGPNFEGVEPDLTLAIGKDGVLGYVRLSEIEDGCPQTPEEALKSMQRRKETINLYLQDGVTVIGLFYLAKGGTSYVMT